MSLHFFYFLGIIVPQYLHDNGPLNYVLYFKPKSFNSNENNGANKILHDISEA